MKRLSLVLCLALCLCLFCACGNPSTYTQPDYTTLDMTPYGPLSPSDLQNITLTVPASCAYTEQAWEDYLTAFFSAYPKINYMTEGVTTSADTLCFYYTATSDGETLLSYQAADGAPAELSLSSEDFMGLTGFNQHLIGVPLGTPLTFSLSASPTHTISWLAGKHLTFTVIPTSIRQEEILTAFDSDYILNTLGWQTTLTDPKEVVETFTTTLKEEFMQSYEEDLHHALEDAAIDLLLSLYSPTAYPSHDVSYNLHALVNYYEAMRLYDNQILEAWGDPADISPTLSDYIMKTYALPTPLSAYERLLEEAKALTKENMAIAAAFHALNLTITDQGTPYLNNLLMYETVMTALTCESNCTIIFIDN